MELADLPLPLHPTLSSFPRMEPGAAMGLALQRLPAMAMSHVQICPQNYGAVDDATIDRLRRLSSSTRYRLHANVRLPGLGLQVVDASSDPSEARTRTYFEALHKAHEAIDAPAYTMHAGRADQASFSQMERNVLELEQRLGSPVGVEGLYPTARVQYRISTWAEYRRLLNSPMRYAIDLSHLHILATQSGELDLGLVQALLADARCIEIHLSANNGRDDSHLPLACCPRLWWNDLLRGAHPAAVAFYEGDELRPDPGSIGLGRGRRRGV